MESDPSVGEPEPIVARLHLHRGPGVFYGVLALVLLIFVALGVVTYAGSGKIVMTVVVAVVGLGVTAFLALLAFSVVAPGLSASVAGIRGRMAWGRAVDVDWSAVTVDVDDDDPPGRFRLDVAGESLGIDRRSWLGFSDFVILIATTPDAAARLTPAARREVIRLLQLEEPSDPVG